MTTLSAHLPATTRIAVIGGTTLIPQAVVMARLIGRAIVEAGCSLVTGGRLGAGLVASEGAAIACKEMGLDVLRHVIAFVPVGSRADFDIGKVINVGTDKMARRVALVGNTIGAIVIGGGQGTRSEVLIAVLEAIMDGYSLLPVSGTGGEASRLCACIASFPNPLLNEPSPSIEKARAIILEIQRVPCWYCDIDPVKAHYEWFECKIRSKTAEEMYRIRHKYF
jgi:predicted Rossmann-fold nucleotide-binding protein